MGRTATLLVLMLGACRAGPRLAVRPRADSARSGPKPRAPGDLPIAPASTTTRISWTSLRRPG